MHAESVADHSRLQNCVLNLGTNRLPLTEIMATIADSNQSAHYCQIRWCSCMYALVNDGTDLVYHSLAT